VEQAIDARRLLGDVSERLGSLSSKTRSDVEVGVVHDLPYRDLAQRLECSEGAARVRVARGLKQIATDLHRKDDFDGRG
jgi:DNA-directed RNA polymerase specialized sigma24 family protein